MSWGYWGIVVGLLVLVTVTFFCLDLFYQAPGQRFMSEDDREPTPDGINSPHEKPATGKHAA